MMRANKRNTFRTQQYPKAVAQNSRQSSVRLVTGAKLGDLGDIILPKWDNDERAQENIIKLIWRTQAVRSLFRIRRIIRQTF